MSFKCNDAFWGARIAPQSRFAFHTVRESETNRGTRDSGAAGDEPTPASSNGGGNALMSSSSLSAHDPNELADAPEAAREEPRGGLGSASKALSVDSSIPFFCFTSGSAKSASRDETDETAGRGGLALLFGFEPHAASVFVFAFVGSRTRPLSSATAFDVSAFSAFSVFSSESIILSNPFPRREL
jgi:hypothetical protein